MEQRALGPEVFQLAALSSTSIGLSVRSDQEQTESLGHQFLFLVIPFGRISSVSPELIIENALYEELARRNYRPILPSGENNLKAPRTSLEVTVKKISLSAYDLLFFRNLRCQILLHATLLDKNGERIIGIDVEQTENDQRSYGFKKQLEELLHLTAEKAVLNVMEKLLL